jgi:pantoate--beta-alanine ligase
MSVHHVKEEKERSPQSSGGKVGSPIVLETVSEFRAWRAKVKDTLALVPTMGALHEGHFSLIEQGRKRGELLAVWIFVNPLQFGPKEDFGAYPRALERDLGECARLGVDVVFAPSVEEMYPCGKDNCIAVVPISELGDVLEGEFRPGFFTGVATVVTKFFNVIQPDVAIFGEKDYQQLLVIKQMVRDLNFPVTVEACPTVRAEDGLAMSSRNTYLSREQRQIAPLLQKALKFVEDKIRSKHSSVEEALDAGRQMISASGEFTLQYLDARDSQTFAPHANAKNSLVLLVAAKLGNVRLIDNIVMRD